MVIFQKARDNATAIRSVGERAREEARRSGTFIYYADKARGGVIVREHPDGRIEAVEHSAQSEELQAIRD